MKRKSDDPLEKVTLNLIKGDYARLQLLFPRQGAAVAVRQLVHSFLRNHAAKAKSLASEAEGIMEDLEGGS